MSTLRPSSLGSSVLLAAALVAVPAAARAQSAVSLTASPPGVSPGATVTLQATVAPAWNQDCGYGCAVIGIQSYLQIAGSNGYYTYTAGYDANGLGLPDSDPGPGQALQPVTYTASGGYHYDLCYYEPGFEFYGCIYGYGSYDEAGSANASVYPAVVPVAVDVSPSSGTGTHQTFVFHYSSAAGASDIGQTWQIVYPSGQGIPSCVIGWYRGTPGTFVLWGDVGWQDQQSAAPNTGVTLENSQCQLHMANTSMSGTGNTLTITTDVTFKPATAGPKVVIMYGWSAGGGYGSQTAAGSWTVPVACEVSPQQTSVPAAAGAVTISVLNGCPWSVPATSGFLTADGATSGSGGTITYSYPANSGVQRAANVTVGDQTVTVTQLAHDQTPTDDVVVYYHTDAIGSVRLVTDANGAPMRAHDFLPFGQDTPAGPNGTDTFLFAGHERDAGVASDYFGARFYSSFAERFATPDPLSITDERVGEPYRLNRYAYAHNNPLRFVDPSGLDPECQEIGALGVVCTDGIVVTATSSDAEKQLVRQRLAMQQAIKDAHSLRVELGSEGGGTLPSADPQPEGPSDTVKWQRIACTLDAGLNFGLSTFVPGYGLLKEVALLANFNIRPFSMAARISPPATAGHTAPSAAAAIASGYWLYRDSMVNWDDLNKLRDWTSRTNSGGENMLKYGARLSSLEKLASAAKFASRVTVGLSAISSAYDVYKCWAD